MKTLLRSESQDAEYALFPLKYEWAWSSYKTMLANFWTPEEIGIGPDLAHWRGAALSDAERHMFLTVFAQLTTFDLLRTADLSQRLISHVHAPEVIHALTTQSFQECLHTHAYQFVIESIGLDQDDIYQRYRTVPALANRCELAERMGRMTTLGDMLRSLIHFYCIFEGVWFNLNLLGPVQALARRGLMKGTAEQFQYIARDEMSHIALGIHLIREFLHEYPQVLTPELKAAILEDTWEALRLEDAFIDYALPTPILGYQSEDHKATARHYAERWLHRIGIECDFGGEHRLTWIDEMVATKKEKNFFETRVTDYQIGALKWD